LSVQGSIAVKEFSFERFSMIILGLISFKTRTQLWRSTLLTMMKSLKWAVDLKVHVTRILAAWVSGALTKEGNI